ncbi:MAG TPA: hypothetical protein VL501_05545 [Pyrinomonadaceae bacterium]|nr:hypothetical protein [Pyrinomonadaceae bacterium]
MAALVMLATIVTVVVNFLAATGRINGVAPDEVSNRYPTVITPAGWTFSIWSLIYTGLIAFSIYQLLPAKVARFDRLRLPYIVSCILNCGWILLWHHFHIGMCAVVITLLLASLFWVNLRIEKPTSLVETIVVKGTFGLYAGWVTVATLVNVLVYLVSSDIEWSATVWVIIGILCLVMAAAAAVLVRIRLGNFVYPLAVAWAAAGIGANQSGKSTAIVVTTAIVCIGCLIVAGTVVTELRDSTSE